MENFSEEDFAKFVAFMRRQQAEETVGETSTTTVAERPELKEQATAHQADSDDEENINLKSDFIIEERVRSLASQEKFYEAASLCENITYVDEMDIGLKLLIAECYVQLGRESKAEKALKGVEKILKKPPMFDVDDVMDLAKELKSNSSHIRALLLIRIVFDVLINDSSLSSDEKVDCGFRCMSTMNSVMHEMMPIGTSLDAQNNLAMQRALNAISNADIDAFKLFSNQKKSSRISERTRILSLDYGAEVMEEMLEKVEPIKNSDPETKTLKIAKFANAISVHYKAFKQFSKAVKVLQFTVDRLEQQFGKNARHYRIYGMTLLNIGSDCLVSEKIKESEVYVMRALEAMEYALDFESEELKRQSIKGIEYVLRPLRSSLKLA